MDQDPTQLVTQRLAELPQGVRDAIQNADLQKKIASIGEKHKLHIDQIGTLESEVLLTMMGFTEAADFENHLQKNLGIDAAASATITADVNTDLLLPIRGAMQEFTAHGAKSAPAPSTMSTSVAAIPAPSAPKLELMPAEALLQEKTVSTPVVPTLIAPKPYTADPYREPPTP